jgi:acetylornithine deacetylase
MITAQEARALDAVDEAATLDLLLGMLAVPSITGTPAESELQHRLASRVERLGLDVDLWPMDLPELRAADGFPGTEAPREEAWGLVATMAGTDGGGPHLVLQGHADVVPPGDLARWAGDPFVPRRAGGVVHGRGACDMKAGLAANIAAVAAIQAAGVRLRRGVALHFVVSEEDGGLGAFGTLRRGHTGDMCIITEPTTGTIITATAGALTFRLSVPGAATHGSTRYAGVSAIDGYLRIHAALEQLEGERNRDVDPLMAEYPIAYPLSVGRIEAGDWASSVPDLLVAEGRMGVRLDEDPEDARRQLEVRVAELCDADPWLRDHPVGVEWYGGQFASGRLPAGHPLAGVVARAHADATAAAPPRQHGAPYGSDLRLYAAAGIPTLHYGPGDVRLAHGPNEQVPLAELLAVTRALVLAVLRTCGTAD